MALKISVISQKGGVGKSTVVRALAVEYARNKWSVKIADMDLKQRTITEWNCQRMENGIKPTIAAEPFKNVAEVLKHDSTYDLIIFDGAGQADSQTLEIASKSDFILLPSGITRDDLNPQIRLAHELQKKGISPTKIAFTLSRVGASKGEMRAAKSFISNAGYYLAGIIQERTSIGKCHDNGFAANETRYTSVNRVIDRMIQNIGDKINQVSS